KRLIISLQGRKKPIAKIRRAAPPGQRALDRRFLHGVVLLVKNSYKKFSILWFPFPFCGHPQQNIMEFCVLFYFLCGFVLLMNIMDSLKCEDSFCGWDLLQSP